MNETPNLKINSSPLMMPYYSNAQLQEQQNEKNQNKKIGNLSKTKLAFGNGNSDEFQKKDPLTNYPLRLCAYSNEVGAAVSPIPGIGHTLFMLSWVPALMYFGADIYDKYAKGKDSDYANPNKGTAFKQAVFQALASVILPTAAVIVGQNTASSLSRFFDKGKMDVRAKEDILSELSRDLNQDKLRSHRGEISNLIKENPNASLNEILEMPLIKNLKENLSNSVFNDLKTESETLRRHRATSGIISKAVDLIFVPKRDCEFISRISPDKFDNEVKNYLDTMVEKLVDTRVMLQRALNSDGTLNEHAKDVDKSTLKKIQKLLQKNIANRDIVDKSSFVVKECVSGKLNQAAMKLSGIKILGGFTFLALLAKPIDKFVEHVIIEKYVEPRLK